jgi:TrmH family RNA methyltransferase
VIERVASTESPQPVLAVVRDARPAAADATFVLVADRLADPGNAGTIIRSAEAAGAMRSCSRRLGRPVQPKVVRASAGSLFRIPVVEARCESLAGFRRLGTSSHRGDCTPTRVPRPCRVVVGNEAHGLDDDAAIDSGSPFRTPVRREPQRRDGRDRAAIRSGSSAEHV